MSEQQNLEAETPETQDLERSGPESGQQESHTGLVLAKEVLPTSIPILPTRPRPFFPGIPIPVVFKGAKHFEMLDKLVRARKDVVGLVLVKDLEGPDAMNNLHLVGVAGKILKMMQTGEDEVHVLLQGVERFKVDRYMEKDGEIHANVHYCYSTEYTHNEELKSYALAIIAALKELVQINPLHGETVKLAFLRSSIEEPGRLADFAANLTTAEGQELQGVLETYDIRARINKVLVLLKKEVEVSKVQQKISKQIEEKVSARQREFFLHEQLKAIKQELGLEKEGKTTELEKYKDRLKKLKLNQEALRTVEEEMDKFKVLEPASPEYNVTRNYLDWLTVLPWGQFSKDRFDLRRAERVLNRDHYGLEDVKDRILEFIAVGKMKGDISGSILCLVGPPGVGKTSIGRSIAEALGRTFYRFSLGGMRDEAEIKGHRRTYIGAMPGKFIQAIKTAGTANPLIMLDEIDKVGTSYHGDPASALLEVLDPEQNATFRDHYLDVPFDLSNVLFVATANQLDTIPGPLLDRMEVIRLSGYILEEKVEIARRYLIPRNLERHGMSHEQLSLKKPVLRELIDGYAREAGVRNLENKIKKIIRRAALTIAKGESTALKVTKKDLLPLLGNPIHKEEGTLDGKPGVVTGLAWTAMGGATLQIEARAIKTSRKGFKQTGQLGAVMMESAEIAYSFVQSQLAKFGAPADFFDTHFIHFHVPAGATPKDGPSAGITIATALLSVALSKPPHSGLAMTGELDLAGRVLPIGGVKEKVIAAKRVKRKILLFPEENRFDFEELPDSLKSGFEVHFVKTYNQVYKIAFA